MFKKITMFLISAAVLISSTGCNKGNSKSNQEPTTIATTYTGRFIEEDITPTPPPIYMEELFFQDGIVTFIDRIDPSRVRRYYENEKKTNFNPKVMPPLDSLGDDINVNSIIGSNSGEYFLSYYSSGSNFLEYAYISQDETVNALSLSGCDLVYLDSFEFSSDGRLFACDPEGMVYEIDVASQTAKLLFSGESAFGAFDVVDKYIIVVDTSGILFYNYEDGKMEDTPEAIQNFIKEQDLSIYVYEFKYFFCDGEDGAFYFACKNGLFRYVMNGNQVEQLFDGTFGHFSNPSYNVSSVIRENEDAFIVAFREGLIMRYRYDASAVNEFTSTLKIYTLTENDTLLQVISEYKMQNPNVRVDYEIGLSSGMTYEDALKNLTTEILSGNAPDVMMLDGVDIDNYIDKHMLLDLSDYDSIIDPNDALLDNVAKIYKNGGLYTMPCKFSVPVVVGMKDDLEKIDSLTDLADTVEAMRTQDPDSFISLLLTEEMLLDSAIAMMGDELFSEGGVNESKLKEMLEACSRIYSCERTAALYPEFVDYFDSVYKEMNGPDKWSYSAASHSGYVAAGDAKITFGKVDNYDLELCLITSLDTFNPDVAYRYGMTNDSSVFIPSCNLGICASSENTEDAIQFLATAFSENVQDITLYDGFPVNLNSIQKLYDKKDSDEHMGIGSFSFDPDKHMSIRISWMDIFEINKFQKALDQLDTPILFDTMTYNTLIETGSKCLDGTITADEAVDEITAQLNLRMKE